MSEVIVVYIDITLTDKFIQPLSRFNQYSLLEEMEKKKIGAKVIRSEIITHFLREIILLILLLPHEKKENNDVVSRTGTEPTDIGFEIKKSMRKYIPNIVSADLLLDVCRKS